MTDRGVQAIREAFAAMRSTQAEARALYELLRTTGQVKSHRAVMYRCASRGCVLLEVLTTPRGLMFRKPAYKLSARENTARSNEAGRAKNTRDGDRHWTETIGMLDHAENLSLNCDHVLSVVLPNADIEAAVRDGVRDVRVSG